MWVGPFLGTTVFVDTAPVVYYVEENSKYLGLVSPFLDAALNGTLLAVTSVVTLSEVLVVPLRSGRSDLAERYRRVLSPVGGIEVNSITGQIAEEAAQIRATYRRIRTPDAIQMATAVAAGAHYFLTNDKALPDLPNLQMLVVDDLAHA
ncbi:MAG: PIN domain-containing protein [Chloroflexota bacterium]|nr:PIN domain-containing protein [Chloroflexota bacterium]